MAGYPLDTVKVRIQTTPPGTYRGTFDCLRHVVAEEGVKGLYRGMSSPLLGVAGINAITFGVNAQVILAIRIVLYWNVESWIGHSTNSHPIRDRGFIGLTRNFPEELSFPDCIL